MLWSLPKGGDSMRSYRSLFIVLSLFVLSAGANGASWVEMGDAPQGVPDRQDTVGVGQLTEIIGSLDGFNGDFVDTYSIIITDPLQFYASTALHLGGSFTSRTERLADSRIWLWSESTFAEAIDQVVLANDNDFNFGATDTGATIAHPQTFPLLTGGDVNMSAANVSLLANTKYLISVSTTPNNPLDGMGNDLANLEEIVPSFDLHGRDASAGPFATWSHLPPLEADNYVISLRGASFCVLPEPTATGFAFLGCIALAYARARETAKKR